MKTRAGGVRVAHPLFHAGGGGSTPTSALSLHFDGCTLPVAKDLVRLWHSQRPLFGSPRARACFTASYEGIFYAGAIWSNPAARLLPQFAWLELRRFAVAPDAPRNTASRMLAWMRRQLAAEFPEVEKLISYSDQAVHSGAIYKADGWHPVELSPGGGGWSHRQGVRYGRVRHKLRWERITGN